MTLYGTKGSGSAAIEAALEIAGLRLSPRRCRVVAAFARARRAEAGQPDRADPDARARRRQRADRERGDPDPSRPRASRERLARERAVAARAADPRPRLHRAPTATPAIGILDYPERWYPDPDDAVAQAMQARGRARLHELWEIFADQFPAAPWLSGEHLGALDILAATVSKWSGRARRRSPRRARSSPRCWRASTPSRASLRSGRATGRRHDARLAVSRSALPSSAYSGSCATKPRRIRAPARLPCARARARRRVRDARAAAGIRGRRRRAGRPDQRAPRRGARLRWRPRGRGSGRSRRRPRLAACRSDAHRQRPRRGADRRPATAPRRANDDRCCRAWTTRAAALRLIEQQHCDAAAQPPLRRDRRGAPAARRWRINLARAAARRRPRRLARRRARPCCASSTTRAGAARPAAGSAFGAASPLAWNERARRRRARAQPRHGRARLLRSRRPAPAARWPSARSQQGYRWRFVGENIAAGQGSPEQVVAGWLASPGHCANIMSPDFAEMGAAYAINPQAAMDIYWTQVFGKS